MVKHRERLLQMEDEQADESLLVRNNRKLQSSIGLLINSSYDSIQGFRNL